MTPDDIVNELNLVNRKLHNEYYRAIREKARLRYDIYKPIEQEIPKYDVNESYPIIEKCIESYKRLSAEDKELIRITIKKEICDLLVSYGINMAGKCLTHPNQNDFTNGLYAMGMGYHDWDIRDIWVWLSTLVDVAMRTGLSYSEYFKSGEPFVEELQKYLMRPDLKDILSVMRRKIVVKEDGTKHYE